MESWFTAQFTVGNIVTILSLAVSVGWQMHRLTRLENDLHEIKEQQVEDVRVIARTYERKDVMTATLQGIHLQLQAIGQAVARLEQMRLEQNR